MWVEVLSAIAGLLGLYVAYVCWCHTYWQRKGVPTLKNTFLLGSLGPTILRRKSLIDTLQDLYFDAKARNLKWAGFYMGTVPEYLITVPELVREVTVKQFDHFTDRQPFAQSNVDDLLARSLLSLKGDEWRKMRHNLSPAFTSSKLRGMMDLMVQIGMQYSKFISSRTNSDEAVDVKNIFRRFAADVIATTAFGTPSNSLDESNSEFYDKGMTMMDFKGKRGLVVMGYVFAPKLMQFLRIPFLPVDLKDFFNKIISGNIKFREQNNKSRPDMLQLLIDERKAQLRKLKEANLPIEEGSVLTDLDISAQAFTFFLGGFETTSTLMAISSIVLGAMQEVQEKLRAEVDDAFAQHPDGKLTYETIQGLKYMDMVISEVQRLVPIGAFGDRVCTKDLDLPEFNLKFKKGDIVGIPFYSLQVDPQYFDDPEDFRPERFSEENKSKIPPFTYLPFGSGPRSCIANRFGLLEVKIAIAYTVAFCTIELNSSDQYPIRFDPKKMDNSPFGGFLLKLRPRENPPVDPDTFNCD
ncbi:cytochrome P450 9e2-like [Neocloeon triangulifer]|uniref:cytochrome P450 9e2-like n=1 Tax=Neocloeon triangulifer TaxID=2078957 RepID=UPI00286ED74A|nr:cytochrome P450 9e2-like [Neocloeon triangulifer]